ncbi:glycosyltransferase family 2 protein, partial [Methylocucumis oryzae]|uniref:glycosyltransferase family 2 protein n=1 Tax=Methylocucumis oryzae TaxID=1632867 RepID=UPI000ABE68F7
MRFHDRINSWHGQALLNTLWLTKLIGKPLGLCFIYKSAVNYLIKRSGLFDRSYYLEQNQDVAASKISALQHYISYGDKEGRHPMPFFDPVYYRKQAKFKAGYANSLLHYAYVGRYQKTSPSPWFDVDFYLRNNKDIARAQIDPLLHYLKWGGKEGRSPCAEFDSTFYLRMYPDVAGMNINPLLHYLTQGRLENRQTIPDQNGNGHEYETSTLAIPSEQEWCQLPKRADIEHCDVDIIIPVYKGRSETLRCLLSVLSAKTETAFQLIVINDASPDAELADDLHRLAEMKLFNLLNNASNQGFVHTVNLGIQLNPHRNIVLLNSDTEVYDGWLDRLSQTAHRNITTGTVTPLSNNATICSYPQFLQDNPYPLELSYAELDQMTAKINRHYEVEAPTGVGFCMYIRRDCLQAVGLFDEKTFGKGYGEENDFCQKAIQKGWRNIIAADVFVRHIGAASFQGEKAKRVQNAIKLLSKRYPKYQKDVDEFIFNDPLKLARCRLDSARLQRMRKEKNVLIVSHNRGGGSERKLQEDIINLTNAGVGVYTFTARYQKTRKVILGHPSIKSFPNINPF